MVERGRETAKPKYETPAICELGALARGLGQACNPTGTNALGACNPSGTAASAVCQTGSNRV